MKDIEFIKLGVTDEECEKINSNIIGYKKELNKIISEARKVSKSEKCIYCGNETTSFCNSHSIPAFCLRNIAKNGELLHTNKFINFPLLDFEKGINKAGTFQIICRECDSKIFQEYEEPNNYENEVTQQMVAQIVMKNSLKAISKRVNEHAIFDILKERTSESIEIADYMQYIQDIDLSEYKREFEKAKRLSKKNWPGEYYVFYYEKLNYVVPVAFQSSIALVVDLDGQIVNDIYCENPKYKIEDFHICIFPLKNTSVVMMFVDSKYKRYRNFYKSFRKLSQEDKLSLVNYIIFLYSEDIFFSKEIPINVLQNKDLIDVSKQSAIALSINPYIKAIDKAKDIYDLSKHNNIPNLLSEQYKLR
ncbi:hypothetical protein [Clostridium perfringens]|uniref:hypothetical protein n=1 Tax=Clostridium perfringens TaxID=1502 RepID=UPI001C84CC79|nr:hypothetical protein [Clostridium perfringens]